MVLLLPCISNTPKVAVATLLMYMFVFCVNVLKYHKERYGA